MYYYYVSISPGNALSAIIQEEKNKLIERLGPELVADGSQACSLTDEPHITLHVGSTAHKADLITALKKVALKAPSFPYRVLGMNQELKQGLIEQHYQVDQPSLACFKKLHLLVLDATLSLQKGLNPIFKEEDFSGIYSNNRDCGFPAAREHYRPHVSVGRVHPELVEISPFIRPEDTYRTGGITIWEYTGEPTFSVCNPIRLSCQ